MRAVAYLRCSTELQDHSISIQEHYASERARKLGYVIEHHFTDEAVSARVVPMAERAGLQELLHEIDAGLVTHLFVYKRDRLARQSIEYMRIYQILKKHGIEVIFTSDNEQPMRYDSIGDFMELIFSGLAEREGNAIHRRIRDAVISNFVDGDSLQSLPYGLYVRKDKDNKSRLWRDEVQLRQVFTLYRLILSKEFSDLNQLRKHLQVLKWRRGKNQEPWTVANISSAIRSTAYKGILTKEVAEREELLRATREGMRVVSDTDWEEANTLLNEMESVRAQGPRMKQDYSLKGLALCALCFKPLDTKNYPIKKRKQYVYRCSLHTKVVVEKKQLENAVFSECKSAFEQWLNEYALEYFQRGFSNYLKQLQLQRNLANQNVKAAEMALAKASARLMSGVGEIDLRRLRHRYNSAILRLKRATRALEIVHKASLLPIGLLERLNHPSVDRRELFKDIVDTVLVDQEGIEIVLRHPFQNLRQVMKNENIGLFEVGHRRYHVWETLN